MKPAGKSLGWSYFFVLAAAGIFFVVSCAPGLLWQDSGMIQYRVWHNDIEGGLGLALSHPLFYVLAIGAKYVPFGDFAFRVNLVSALAAALAVANLYLLLRLWLGSGFAAVIGAVTLAVSHTFWRHGSIVETYTLYTAIFLGELILLLLYCQRRNVKYLYWLGFFNGLAISVHMLGVIPLACYGVFFLILVARKGIRVSDLLCIIVFWAVGALCYEWLIIKNIIETGDIFATLSSAAFGNGWKSDVLNTSISLEIIKENILFFVLNFPTPNILIGFAGLIALIRSVKTKTFNYFLILISGLFLVFASRYTIVDRYAFFIPFYATFAIFIGVGVYFLQRGMKRNHLLYLITIFAFVPIGAYAAAPIIAEKVKLNLGTKRQIPYRNDYKYFLQPWKTGYNGADRFANEVLNSVGANAVIYADGTTVYPLLLEQQISGKRADIKIVTGHGSVNNIGEYGEGVIDRLFEERPIYVVSAQERYCPDFLLERYDFEKTGLIFKAVKKGTRSNK